ncbi:MAG: hypothetical protein M3518_05705 [Actinomycetota bacterium]|nr:hypothetical protein [Actinomycetota bacterium]
MSTPESSANTAQTTEETETRECRSCRSTGYVLLDVAYDHETGRLTGEAAPCMICKGGRPGEQLPVPERPVIAATRPYEAIRGAAEEAKRLPRRPFEPTPKHLLRGCLQCDGKGLMDGKRCGRCAGIGNRAHVLLRERRRA